MLIPALSLPAKALPLPEVWTHQLPTLPRAQWSLSATQRRRFGTVLAFCACLSYLAGELPSPARCERHARNASIFPSLPDSLRNGMKSKLCPRAHGCRPPYPTKMVALKQPCNNKIDQHSSIFTLRLLVLQRPKWYFAVLEHKLQGFPPHDLFNL